jgi:guanosine-3',5'-bis(diphosphate) 3'-pyrophosphohydrolase
MLLSTKYLHALDVVSTYHGQDLRKDNKTPYISHPLTVMQLVYEMGYKDEDILVAALIHDLLEDTNITEQEIVKDFGKHVLDLANEVSTKDKTLTRQQKYKYKIDQIGKLSKKAAVIKFADVLHNTKHLIYQSNHYPNIEKKFHGGFKRKAKFERERLEQFKIHHKFIKQMDELEQAVMQLEGLVKA